MGEREGKRPNQIPLPFPASIHKLGLDFWKERMGTSMILFLCLVLSSCNMAHARGVGKQVAPHTTPRAFFNVVRFGARANGRVDDTKAFKAAWKAACAAAGHVTIYVPEGTYLIGPIKFKGPCRRAQSITFNLRGYLKASTHLSIYEDFWIMFGWLNRLTLTGGGTIDGQGAASWPFNTCPKNFSCKLLPTSLKFVKITNSQLKGITSLNSKFFHIVLLSSTNLKVSGIKIFAPKTSPNTDGIHIERCSRVNVSHCKIATGDDCISIGHGNSHLFISDIACGPGHGISVGSLGKYPHEKDVRGLVVKDCVFNGTRNGVRIKTWQNSPRSTQATDMTFQNIVMNNVANPIIIDQTYCPFAYCEVKTPSRVKISNIFFKNIRGTSATPVAVTLDCSKGIPCKNINLQNVHLDYRGGRRTTSHCRNVRARYRGTQIPPPCS